MLHNPSFALNKNNVFVTKYLFNHHVGFIQQAAMRTDPSATWTKGLGRAAAVEEAGREYALLAA